MKPVMLIGVIAGVGVLGFIAYRYMMQSPQTYQPATENPFSRGQMTTSDQQKYPFVANIPPRMDNSNQPWFNNNRVAVIGASAPKMSSELQQFHDLSSFMKSGNDIIESGQSIWNNVSSWWDSGDADSTLGDWSYT